NIGINSAEIKTSIDALNNINEIALMTERIKKYSSCSIESTSANVNSGSSYCALAILAFQTQ
ncbi:MAG: hypothetical protein ACXV8P_05020, partial [Methylobacter sp.]